MHSSRSFISRDPLYLSRRWFARRVHLETVVNTQELAKCPRHAPRESSTLDFSVPCICRELNLDGINTALGLPRAVNEDVIGSIEVGPRVIGGLGSLGIWKPRTGRRRAAGLAIF